MTGVKHLAVLKSAAEASRGGLIDTAQLSLPADETGASSPQLLKCESPLGRWLGVIKLFRICVWKSYKSKSVSEVKKPRRQAGHHVEGHAGEEGACFVFVSAIIVLLLLILHRRSRSGRKAGEPDQ